MKWRALFVGALCLASVTGAVQAGRAIIVLDGSGSMWGQVNGEAKIDIAKRVVGDLLESIGDDVELGLMCYGHRRKGDCDDIEMLVPPGKVDRAAFREVVNGILPKGKTPLTEAVERAALELRYVEEAADVILVSDGIETCDRDPCELAKRLAAAGVGFRAHVVAFDLTAEEAGTIRCLADETGGSFLPASDAGTLRDALGTVVERVVVPAAVRMEEAKEVLETPAATLQAADSVPAGLPFEVSWTGPDDQGDFITILDKTRREREWGNYTYTKQGSPLQVVALIDPGEYELRYVWAKGNRVAARRPITVTPTLATVSVPAEVVAGSEFPVEWTGPKQPGDFITIVAPDAEDRAYNHYVYTANGESPAMVRAVDDAGAYEVRYVAGQKNRILARSPIKVLPAEATVRTAPKVAIGSAVEVTWKGPANQGDYITMVAPDAAAREYNDYVYTKGKTGPVTIRAVEVAGTYEVRYVTGQDSRVIARSTVEVEAVDVTLKHAATVLAGAPLEVAWTGPGNKLDYITVVPKGAPGGSYKSYEYTKKSPLVLTAPEDAGPHEVRYVTGGEKRTLASSALVVREAKATLKVASKAAAGGKLEVAWTGPGNARDYVTIVPEGSAKGKYGSYEYVRAPEGSVTLAVPAKAGAYEVWYVTANQKKVLARAAVEVVAE